MKLRGFVVILLVVLTSSMNSQTNTISFQQIVEEGFQNNYSIKLEKLNVTKSNYTLLRAGGFLNPYFDTEVVYGSGVDPTVTNDGTKYFQTSLIIPTKLGIDFYSGARTERTRFIDDPDYTLNNTGAWIGATIPLLRGLGRNSEVNAFIESSKLNQKALEEQFSNQVLSYFRDLLSSYLTLTENKKEYAIEEMSYKEAKKYQEDIDELAQNDLLPKVEKHRAKAFVEQKLQQLNLARLETFGAYYQTKILLGGSNKDVAKDSIPDLADEIPNPEKDKLKQFIATTKQNLPIILENTPQYKNIALRVEENKVLLNNAKNQKRNQLDLDVRVSRFGVTRNVPFNLGNTLRSTYPGSSVLVSLTHNIPVRNERLKGAYLEQLTEYDISKTFLQQYLFESTVNSNLTITLLEQKIELFEQTKLVVELMKQNYLDEQAKFKLGNATQIDVLLSFDNYFAALKSLNNLKYEIWRNYVTLKFIVGELPSNQQELNDFTLLDLFR